MSRKSITIRAVGATVLAVALLVATAGGANAQSPTPGHKMEDSRPGNGWPDSAGAAVVEGLGSLNCLYSESSIKSQTVSWINAGHWVVTEISPQSGCGSVSDYEGLLNRIKNYVEANATAPGSHWAGFMLDEEPNFGFGVSSLETINQYTENIMVNTPGMSWYFTEDFPRGSAGDWTLGQYNAILGYSWPAPQVYNSFMIGFVNNECSTYGNCTNNVTVDSQLASPWNDPTWVTSQIHGSPWNDFGYWCSCNWYNLWRPQ